MLSDVPTISAIALAALGLGAGAMRLGQMALKKGGDNSHPATPKSAGLTAAEWKAEIAGIVTRHSNETIMPLLAELKKIAQQQVEIQQKQNEILVELVTVSRIGRRP